MKIIYISFWIVCLFVLSCKKDKTENSNVNLSQGLIAYYAFNGNANDESGNGNNGTIFNNATIVADKNGKPQSALNVNGTNGVLVADGSKLVPLDEMTISFDVMQRQTGNRQIFLSAVNYNTGLGFGYFIGPSNTSDARTIFGVARNGFVCTNVYNEAANNILGPVFEKESWYTVVVTFKNGELKMYSNSVLAGEGTAPASKTNSCQNANFIIGNWWKNDPIGLNGKIDNVRVYNRVLNVDEIKALEN